MGNCGMCTRACLAHATYDNTAPDTLQNRTLVVKPVKITDGDTLWVVALTSTCCNAQRLCIRMAGYDSPELHPRMVLKTDPAYAAEVQAALAAKEFLTTLLGSHTVTAVFQKRDKYGRHLAELFVHNKSVNAAMLAAGHGVPYSGGTKARFVA